MTWTYRYLDDLPSVPEELLAKADLFKDNAPIIDLQDKLGFWNGKWEPTADYKRIAISNDLQTWFDDNLIKGRHGVVDIGFSYHNYKKYNNVRQHPHIDKTRHCTMMYLADLGGENATTSFWRETGQPLVRSETYIMPDNIAEMNPRLELVDSFRIEAKRWVVINAKIIHSVENLTSCRYGIQISLDKHNFITENF